MRVALHTWNTGPAEAWDAHGNVAGIEAPEGSEARAVVDEAVAAWLAGERR